MLKPVDVVVAVVVDVVVAVDPFPEEEQRVTEVFLPVPVAPIVSHHGR